MGESFSTIELLAVTAVAVVKLLVTIKYMIVDITPSSTLYYCPNVKNRGRKGNFDENKCENQSKSNRKRGKILTRRIE